MSNILDFKFDPTHSEELSIISDNTLSVFSDRQRKILLNVDVQSPDDKAQQMRKFR